MIGLNAGAHGAALTEKPPPEAKIKAGGRLNAIYQGGKK
jgi:hypothetical protein